MQTGTHTGWQCNRQQLYPVSYNASHFTYLQNTSPLYTLLRILKWFFLRTYSFIPFLKILMKVKGRTQNSTKAVLKSALWSLTKIGLRNAFHFWKSTGLTMGKCTLSFGLKELKELSDFKRLCCCTRVSGQDVGKQRGRKSRQGLVQLVRT